MRNALHDYAKLFEKYAAANGGWGVILAGEDCLSLANEMMIDADALEAENAKLRELVRDMFRDFANADYELKRNHGRTFMAVTRYEPRLQELGIEVDE